MTNLKMSATAMAVMFAFSASAVATEYDSANDGTKTMITKKGGDVSLILDVNKISNTDPSGNWAIFSSNFFGLKSVNYELNVNTDANFGEAIKFQNTVNVDNGDIRAKATVNVKKGSKLTGNIINQYVEVSYKEQGQVVVPPVASGNDLKINLDGATWEGQLLTEGAKGVVPEGGFTNNTTVSLKNGSSWVGGVQYESGNVTNVDIDATSTWTVNEYATVNQLTSQGNVILNDGMLLTFQDGTSQLAKLKSGQNTEVLMGANAKVTIDSAEGNTWAHFDTFEGTYLNIKDAKDGVKLTVDGRLNNQDADVVIGNLNKVYDGADATFDIAAGDITDAITGTFHNNEATYSTQKNDKMLSIDQMTTMTMMQWRSEADDMNQRMGELRNGTASNGVWARTYGGKAEATLAENEYYGLQIGMDRNISEGDMGHWVGAALSYTDGDGTYTNGTSDNYTFAFTGYSTWLTQTGSYLDLSAKFGKLHDDFQLGTLAGKYDTQAMALSAEMGHRFPITNVFFVEPQVAMTYGHVFAEDYSAGNGVSVRQDSVNSYVARAGLMAGLQCPDNKGSLWVRASYLYDFDGESTTKATQDKLTNTIDQDFGGGWYELGLGATMNITPNLSGYADFEYVAGGEIDTPYRWNVGVRYSF